MNEAKKYHLSGTVTRRLGVCLTTVNKLIKTGMLPLAGIADGKYLIDPEALAEFEKTWRKKAA